MDYTALDAHLSQISTTWTALLNAHEAEGKAATEAQRQLLTRYSRAAYRYLLGAVRDPSVADDLFQEFALRLLRGDFKRADPRRGRFRDYLKTSLYHLIVDYQRKQRQPTVPLPSEGPMVADSTSDPADQEFLDIWRAELMARAWEALAKHDEKARQHLFTVLRFRTDHPDIPAPEMAKQLAERIGKPITGGWIRKRLFLARERFTEFLLDEVTRSLESPTQDRLESELQELGLLDYCRTALERRNQASPEAKNARRRSV